MKWLKRVIAGVVFWGFIVIVEWWYRRGVNKGVHKEVHKGVHKRSRDPTWRIRK